MDTKKTQLTKDTALRQLGVPTRRARNQVSSLVDSVQVDAGRQLLKRNSFMPAVLVGVTGSANVHLDGEHIAHIEAPFVIDQWAADDKRLADFDVVASAKTTLLFVDWRDRQSVFEQVPALRRLSNETQTHVQAELVIDLTEAQPARQEIPS